MFVQNPQKHHHRTDEQLSDNQFVGQPRVMLHCKLLQPLAVSVTAPGRGEQRAQFPIQLFSNQLDNLKEPLPGLLDLRVWRLLNVGQVEFNGFA